MLVCFFFFLPNRDEAQIKRRGGERVVQRVRVQEPTATWTIYIDSRGKALMRDKEEKKEDDRWKDSHRCSGWVPSRVSHHKQCSFPSLVLVLLCFLFLLNSFLNFSFFFPSPTKRHYSLDVDTRVSSPGRSADAAQRKDPGGWLWCVMYLSLLFYSVVSVHCTLSTLCKYCTLSALLVQSTVDNIIRYSVLIFVRWSHDTHDTAKPKIARVQVF